MSGLGLSSVAAMALQGLREQAKNLEAAAGNIAEAESGEYTAQGAEAPAGPSGENADLANEMLNLTEDELSYRANAAVFEAGADLWELLGVVSRD